MEDHDKCGTFSCFSFTSTSGVRTHPVESALDVIHSLPRGFSKLNDLKSFSVTSISDLKTRVVQSCSFAVGNSGNDSTVVALDKALDSLDIGQH